MQREKKSRLYGCVSLTKEQIDFLDNISKCCRYSGGKKISKTAIIRVLISVSRELDINLKAIKSEEQLKEKLIEACCKYK